MQYNGKVVDEEMTKKELLEVAKHYGIKGRHGMDKSSLLEHVLEFTDPTKKDTVAKDSYIANVKPGMLVAFNVNDKKVLSGVVEECRPDKMEFIVKTRNGVKFEVRYKNIIWVKTGPRWPRGVYLALRGESDGQDTRRG